MVRLFVSLLLFTLNACGISNYPSAQPYLDEQQIVYRLHPGDIVYIRVFEEPDLTGKFKIDSQGQIALPLVGKVDVNGQTEKAAAQSIATALQKGGFLKHAKVALEMKQTRPIFIMGEVEHAGSYPFENDMTVYQAIAIAGGYTYRADRHDIAVRRQTGKGAGTEQRLSASEDTPVLPGDVIEIGERFF